MLDHRYGDHVHILDDAWSRSALARLGHPDTQAPLVHELVEACYRHLARTVIARELVRAEARALTRLGVEWEGEIVDPAQRVVVVDVARAGIIPAYVFQRELLNVVDPPSVRVDHVYMQRATDEHGHVTGVTLHGSKIGGPVDGATVIIPDPMAATGGSVSRILGVYAKARRIVVCHLMVTPEYLKRVQGVVVYALRLDRGLSDPDVLATPPGTHWDRERGLNDKGYIVPGAGGLGEILNNTDI